MFKREFKFVMKKKKKEENISRKMTEKSELKKKSLE